MICKFHISFLCVLTLLLLSGCATYESSLLIVSIRSDDAYSVKSLIESGEDVNALSFDLIDGQYWKITPLIRASITGNVDVIKMLLKAGADVNGRDAWGDTALMAATEFGHIEVTKLLIKSGASVDATKPDQTTALMIASLQGNLKITNILLDAGADVNIGYGGDTTLSLAAWKGNAEIVEVLVRKGAIVDRTELLRWAVKNNLQNIIKFFDSAEVIKVENMFIEEKRTLLNNPDYKSKKLNDPCKVHSDCVGELLCVNQICLSNDTREITYIKINHAENIYKEGKVFYTVDTGDILELLQTNTCDSSDQECWDVRNILTGKSGYIEADQIQSNHHVYTRKGRYPFQAR